ncbi:type IV secretion system protein VirB10 [Cereibacter sphaeroides]|uniref:type IV secretion system protein VirB10 n=1 Tax=Cereibacter sphaeroides TaxID=1063 RepID=UPI001F40DD5E|nr:type IV secretion system protein VirB10 [Cereibacter sphaeroides]MCE6967524.1 type IV secretion system protein VirB10 [Cereibacter sphaeroides]
MAEERTGADAAEPSVEGERGISSITAGQSPALSEANKKILVAAGIMFLGALAYLQWPTDEAPPEEEKVQEVSRLRPSRDFQPAEFTDPQPAPTPAAMPAAEPVEPAAPLGPIERARVETAAPVGQSEAQLLYESSQRAPLMAYSGSINNNINQIIGSEPSTSAGGLFGAGAAPENGPVGLAAELVSSDRDAAKATRLAHPELTVTQGTIIPCVLDTAMDSTAPGMVRCTVTDDVWSTTGSVILLDRGSRIVGEYRGGMQRGRKRMFVLWTRAETPAGVVVNLGSPAVDAVGRSGFAGDLDTQFWSRFGGTLMLSVIDAGLVAAANENSSAETTTTNVSDLAGTELDHMIDVPVILRKNQGEEVAVMVARDLDFSGVYRLR